VNNITLRNLMKDLKENISYDKPYIIEYHEHKYVFNIKSGLGYDLMEIKITYKDNAYITSLVIQPNIKEMSNELLAYEVEETLHLMVESIENDIIGCLCSYTYYLDPRNLEYDKQMQEKYKEKQIQYGLRNATKEQLEQALKEINNE
jgi:hypothetical protein